MKFFLTVFLFFLVACGNGNELKLESAVITSRQEVKDTEIVSKPEPESESNKKSEIVKIPEKSQTPFKDWWDVRSGLKLHISGDYIFHEQIEKKRRPFKPKYGKIKFLKDKEGSFVLMTRFADKAQSQENMIDKKLITPKSYIEYYPAKNGQKAQRKESKLEGEKNRSAKRFLNTVMIFGRSYAELKKDFLVQIIKNPVDSGNWSFSLKPLDSGVVKDLQVITVEMNRAAYKKIVFKESKKSWIGFEFMGVLDFKSKIKKQELLDAVK